MNHNDRLWRAAEARYLRRLVPPPTPTTPAELLAAALTIGWTEAGVLAFLATDSLDTVDIPVAWQQLLYAA